MEFAFQSMDDQTMWQSHDWTNSAINSFVCKLSPAVSISRIQQCILELNIHQCAELPRVTPETRSAATPVETASIITLRVLPTMSLHAFRMKIFKSIKMPGQKLSQVSIELWLKMRDDDFAEMDRSNDDKDLAWWGLDNGSDVYVYTGLKV